jgi:hypothetical protein
MNILEEYQKHCAFLQTQLSNKSETEKQTLRLTLLNFCFLIPNFEKLVAQHISITLNKTEFVSDIIQNNMESYRSAVTKAEEAIDEYTEDYEELDTIEILTLSMFDAILLEDSSQSVFQLFNGIIELLDYYQQFSDRPNYWNTILAEELQRQKELLATPVVDANYYTEVYKNISFETL